MGRSSGLEGLYSNFIAMKNLARKVFLDEKGVELRDKELELTKLLDIKRATEIALRKINNLIDEKNG